MKSIYSQIAKLRLRWCVKHKGWGKTPFRTGAVCWNCFSAKQKKMMSERLKNDGTKRKKTFIR